MLMLPSPSRWTIVPAAWCVVALERTLVPIALIQRQSLVRLHRRRVAGHDGEHHCDEATIEAVGQRPDGSFTP
jgi:hypothetical protein